uniref:Uncharacterized protein n=1 Tax=mine drainage metagenome TaxID=410659 RepID=E6Q2A3_9ZZZZ
MAQKSVSRVLNGTKTPNHIAAPIPTRPETGNLASKGAVIWGISSKRKHYRGKQDALHFLAKRTSAVLADLSPKKIAFLLCGIRSLLC